MIPVQDFFAGLFNATLYVLNVFLFPPSIYLDGKYMLIYSFSPCDRTRQSGLWRSYGLMYTFVLAIILTNLYVEVELRGTQ